MAEYMRYDSETGDVYPKADFKLPRGSLFQSEMALPGHESSIKTERTKEGSCILLFSIFAR